MAREELCEEVTFKPYPNDKEPFDMKARGASIAAKGNSRCRGHRKEYVKHVHQLGRMPVWLELNETREEWQER